ncbi:hypothetical protein GJ698_00740 [Pseudoduganella sp. FT26W]|uniref:Uncharacterized protein n=1 Tax=Duganella aquatilis TaxID=2666082 RepID=A0A844CPJ0_9BURK|nr:hypothetical protein [Duganella aquatilis]MRW82617.1 hypothetical protein [Duganella aquatilis]
MPRATQRGRRPVHVCDLPHPLGRPRWNVVVDRFGAEVHASRSRNKAAAAQPLTLATLMPALTMFF